MESFHSPLFEHVRTYFEKYDSEHNTIFLFVPYVKTRILSMLLEGLHSKVVVITTWEPKDILFGSSELELYPFCKERGISLYVHEHMHLKVYSVSLDSAILATGNISHRGLLPGGNYEAAAMFEHLTNEDRLFFEKIRREARLVDDTMYDELKKWRDNNKMDLPEQVSLSSIIPSSQTIDFLISALPMTRSVDELILGYERIGVGREPSDDPEITACIFHDLANYGIDIGKRKDEFVQEITKSFFAHPFIKKIDEFIAPEAYFGGIKEWIQNNCTDVPVPSRRELTGNVQVLLEWFTRLDNEKYVVDVPGKRSQRIRNVKYED